MSEDQTKPEESKVKGLIQKEELLESSGDLQGVAHFDVELGPAIGFSFDSENGVQMNFGDMNQHAPLTSVAIGQITRSIGMSGKYFENTPAELTVPHLNYYYQQKMKDQKARRH